MTLATAFYGPPGTGKTTRLVRTIREEANNGANIQIVSYTKAAAKEIADRAGVGKTGTIRAATVHSVAFGLGRCKMASTVDIDKLQRFTQDSGFPFSGRIITEDDDISTLEIGDEYMSVYNLARAQMRQYDSVYDESHRPGTIEEFDMFCRLYDEWKANNGFYDFNDMLTRARGVPYVVDALVVDEAQDLSPAQWELIYGWSASAARVYIAGDDDQAIYVWSGAKLDGMTSFERDFNAKRVVLDQSYRIPIYVHQLAEEIIAPVEARVEKIYKPREEVGTIDRYDSFGDITIDPSESTLVLYRNHSLRRDVEDVLTAQLVPHVFDNGGRAALQSPLADAARSWERSEPWTLIPSATKSYIRRIFTRRQLEGFEFTGEWPLDPLLCHSAPYRLRSVLAGFRHKFGGIPGLEGISVRLSSIHGAKGREADHVILINGMSGKTASAFEDDKDSERRVFYVGVTRARHKLSVVTGENAVDFLL